MSLNAPIPTSPGAVQPKQFIPSPSALREDRNRRQADQLIDQFITRFTEKEYFPEGGDSLLFAMLTRLQQWPRDMQIIVVDQEGEEIASYLKGNDDSIIRRSVMLTELPDDGYSAVDGVPVAGPEALFQLIFRQLPASSDLGLGGNFPGSNTTAGRIVTVREQVSQLARSERALLFEALLADGYAMKEDPQITRPNPFLPWRTLLPAERTPLLAALQMLYPELAAERLEDVLNSTPLTSIQESEFLEVGALPEPFVTALQASVAEWTRCRAIDGLMHTRTYDPDTDLLARDVAARLLSARTGRDLVVVEAGQRPYESTGPEDNHVVLVHAGDGNYQALDLRTEELSGFPAGTDSFYLAIATSLQPHERSLLGLTFARDTDGMRAAVSSMAVEDNGGWFAREITVENGNNPLPEWLMRASSEDKRAWGDAIEAYSYAVLAAQAPGLPDLAAYNEPAQLRNYTRERLRERLSGDHGVTLEPEDIFVETTDTQIIGGVTVEGGIGSPILVGTPEVITDIQSRNLIDLCLQNLGVTDLNFLTTGRVLHKSGVLVSELSALYIFGLVRDLNVGENYPAFLNARLLTSTEGQWCQERYAQVMQAQLRVDALEARLAGDYLEKGQSPAGQEDRGFKWVTAVLDHPVDDGARAHVEGHSIKVRHLRINEIRLEGPLVIGVASRESVPALVIYTPGAPGGKRFREFRNLDELKAFVVDPENLEYLVSVAPLSLQAELRLVITHRAARISIYLDDHPQNIFTHSYQTKVQRLITQVDRQTHTNWEKNWQSVWEITRTVGEIALVFTPFRVALPVAAIRSFYAVVQGVQRFGKGDQQAAAYFLEAALSLLDALPGPKRPRLGSLKTGRATILNFKETPALPKVPNGLQLRTDGIYKGVHETSLKGHFRFCVMIENKAYPVRYDTSKTVWRLVDPRRPEAFYQTPIALNNQGVWDYSPVGLLGGHKKFRPKRATDGAGNNPGPSRRNSGKRLMTLDMDGFFESRAFRQAERGIEGDLTAAVNKAVERYRLEGKGNLHKSEGGLFSLDLPGLGASTGRGKWRLMFSPPDKGVMKPHSIRDPH